MVIVSPLITVEGLTIKNHLPGRLRLKVLFRFDRIVNVLEDLVCGGVILSCRVSRMTQSLLVRYDACQFSMEAMQRELFQYVRDVLSGEKELTFVTVPTSPLLPKDERSVQIKSDLPGRIRFHHASIAKYPVVLQRVELMLVNREGVKNYHVSGLSSTVLISFDEAILSGWDLLEELDEIIKTSLQKDDLKPDVSLQKLALSTLSLGVVGFSIVTSTFLPVALVSSFFMANQVLSQAHESLFVEKKINYRIIDALLFMLCLVSGRLFSGTLIVWGGVLSQYLVTSSSIESRKLLTKVFGRQARKSWRLVNGIEVEVPVAEIVIGDLVVVHAGEQIPVDGVVVHGAALVDQHTITGESAPMERLSGDRVFAMSMVMSGKVTVQVEEVGENTNVSKISRVIEHSMQYKVRAHSAGENFANFMVIPTLCMVSGGYFLIGSDGAMAILNCDYGSGVRRSAPIALMATLSMAAKHGIVIKNSGVLETLSEVDAVVFDKTGTLTDEMPVVKRIRSCDDRYSEEDILAYVAAAEMRFSHPIARSVVEAAEQIGVTLPVVDDSCCHIGFGVEVEVREGTLKVGSQRFMEREGVVISGYVRREVDQIHKKGCSAVFAAVNRRLIGFVEMQASHREESSQVIRNLKKRGIQHIYLISGDHEEATRSVAEELGIDSYFSEVLPEEKANYVRKLQEQGHKVAMVGDGVNDTMALSMADCSISLRGAAEVATDVADIVFLDGDLKKFNHLFEISDALRDNIQRSAALIVFPNLLGVVGAMLGVVGLTSSLFINGGFNILATINGFLPYYKVLQENDEST